jgi:hypothetical protein
MVFTSQTYLFIMYLVYHSGNMFRLAIESSSGPYIKIQMPNFYSKCVMGTQTLTCFVLICIMVSNVILPLHW